MPQMDFGVRVAMVLLVVVLLVTVVVYHVWLDRLYQRQRRPRPGHDGQSGE